PLSCSKAGRPTAHPRLSEVLMLPPVTNLFQAPTVVAPAEQLISLLQTPHLRLEQIVSHGQPTAAGCWYDQAAAEWVLLARGTATLQFEAGESLALKAGDYLLIPAHVKHRVECCSADALWLALHYGEAVANAAIAGATP
ncbi:MAG: cupin domain-containing protein, partial [Pseudomonas sp.]|uniref:cupin domain-containing protein n=1 Tax=Pseudomonas sp. TaxID=306 RepID=UPI003BB4C91E